MSPEEYIPVLKEILQKINPKIDLTNVNMDTPLATELGINSLSMLFLALAIEDKLQIRFENKEPFVTVGDVCNYIAQCKA